MTQKQIHSFLYYFSDQMMNLILEVDDEDNLEYESCLEWLSEKYQYYKSYLVYFQVLYKDLKHPSKKIKDLLNYFMKEEMYFVLRIKQLEEEQINV